MINYILGLFSKDIGIDLGTANTLIYVKGEGIVLCEPSVVAIDKSTNKVLKVGEEAKMMLGRTPGDIVAIRPMMDGVIADFEITEKMIREFISKAYPRRTLIGPRIVIGVPSGITEVEKKAVRDAAEMAGARHGEVYLIEEPMAAAIGANMPITEPAGNMIVDIGGGTTEVAIISLGGMVLSNSIRVGGNELDEAIANYIKKAYNLLIGERTSEEIKIRIGSAFPLPKEESMEVKGRDAVTGLPKTLKITSEEVREAMSGDISSIVHLVISTLEKTPPELASDIVDRGIVLAGGGSLLRGLDKLLLKETGLPIIIADDPLRCVVLGTGKCLEEIKFLKRIK
ncbi:rod shape-determining protein, partial [bacterium]|nr:rod shape-determining protein [bacterium]MBU1614361.1 rod shape-determining protein [bacterium]